MRSSAFRLSTITVSRSLASTRFIKCANCDLYLDRQSIDTTTPMGKLMFQVTGAFAEFERSMIRQRVHAGLKRAVEAGKTRIAREMNRPFDAAANRIRRHR